MLRSTILCCAIYIISSTIMLRSIMLYCMDIFCIASSSTMLRSTMLYPAICIASSTTKPCYITCLVMLEKAVE